MSLRAETFYALQCDFPECEELWEGYEYTYFADGPDTSNAQEDGWFVDDSTGEAYCSAHTIEVDCPPEMQKLSFDANAVDDTYCEWCEDHATDQHLAPMPDTWENRLRVALTRITDRAVSSLDRLEMEVCGRHGKLGENGSLARRTHHALNRIYENTCRSWKSDITHQEMYDLQHPRPEGTNR